MNAFEGQAKNSVTHNAGTPKRHLSGRPQRGRARGQWLPSQRHSRTSYGLPGQKPLSLQTTPKQSGGREGGGELSRSVVCGADNTSDNVGDDTAWATEEGVVHGTVGSRHVHRHARPSSSSSSSAAVWVEVDISLGAEPGTVDVDLVKLNGSALVAVRYAWSNIQPSCCLPSADDGLHRAWIIHALVARARSRRLTVRYLPILLWPG